MRGSKGVIGYYQDGLYDNLSVGKLKEEKIR